MELGYQNTNNRNPVYKRVMICSKDIKNGQYILPMPLFARACRFESVTVPNTWRTVDENNNRLNFERASPDPGGQLTITLPVGNYNITTLITEIQNLLNASEWGTSASVTWTVTHESAPGTKDPRIKISNNSNWFFFVKENSSAAKLCGFLERKSSGTSYIASHLAKLNRVSMLNVISQEIGSRLFDNIHSSFQNSSAVVFSSPTQGAFGQVFSYHDTTSHYNFFNQFGQDQEQVSYIDMTLTDEDNNEINFQGHHWYVTMSFML